MNQNRKDKYEAWRGVPPGLERRDFLRRPELKLIRNNIMAAAVLAYISVVMTFVVTVIIGQSLFAMIDVVILLVCGLLIQLKQSRAASVILLIYSIYNFIATIVLFGTVGGWLIIIAGIFAVKDTFRFYKIWEEYSRMGVSYQQAFPGVNSYGAYGNSTSPYGQQGNETAQYGAYGSSNSPYGQQGDDFSQNGQQSGYNYGYTAPQNNYSNIPGPGGFMPNNGSGQSQMQPQKTKRGPAVWIILAVLILAAAIGTIVAVVGAGNDDQGELPKRTVEENYTPETTPTEGSIKKKLGSGEETTDSAEDTDETAEDTVEGDEEEPAEADDGDGEQSETQNETKAENTIGRKKISGN